MPGFDGTGPMGQGPLSGRGGGFCVLKRSKENPYQIQGLAGINGTPVRQVKTNETLGFPWKEVIDMPFGDGTGPAGLGPMTGRVAGFCAGYPAAVYMNPVAVRGCFYGAGAYGYGAGYGLPYGVWANPRLRRGFGRGFGRGRGWGRGRGTGRFGYWW
jgi:hypothetical protein